VLLVLREPLPNIAAGSTSPLAALRKGNRPPAPNSTEAGARRAAQARLARRLTEATELLAPAGITVTTLDPGQSTAVLAAACNPDSLIPPSAGLAGADEVITTAPIGPDDTTANRWQDDWSDDQPEQATPAERFREESDAAWDEDDEPWSQR
jgi:NAD(P)-dependent dehydrogenase (short-subunit alcohol dehydrogenase family)